MLRTNRPIEQAMLLDKRALSQLLNCSQRHIDRMVEAERMPKPYRLGNAVRWDRSVVESWIQNGCPSVKEMEGAQ